MVAEMGTVPQEAVPVAQLDLGVSKHRFSGSYFAIVLFDCLKYVRHGRLKMHDPLLSVHFCNVLEEAKHVLRQLREIELQTLALVNGRVRMRVRTRTSVGVRVSGKRNAKCNE